MCFGASVVRYAGRISNGELHLEGETLSAFPAIWIEAQNSPDALNYPIFPLPFLDPGKHIEILPLLLQHKRCRIINVRITVT